MNTMDIILIICIGLVIYHHGVYPLALSVVAKYKQRRNLQSDCIKAYQPKIAVFMAAHNEQAYIYDKLINIASQIYPNEKIAIHLVLDGCTDDTLACATPALDRLAEQNIFCHIDVFDENKGKLNAINHLINLYSSDYDVVLFSDVSAMLSINAFQEVACKMADKKVAVVSGLYQVYDQANNEQSGYWALQNFIQTGTFQKVGSETLQTVNVRFVCATNRDPWLEVQEGRFREDLYYRLYVIPIQLPPLRDRGEDVVQIAQAMFERIAKEEGKFFEKLTENAKQKLLNYDWPGNVRQLENMIRNTLVMNHSEVIDAHMFPAFPVSNSNVQQIAPPNQANALSTPNPSFDEVQTGSAVTTANEPVATMQSHFDIRPMWIVEKEYIEQAIEICGNNIPKAAAMLELSPSTIYRKMKTWEQ